MGYKGLVTFLGIILSSVSAFAIVGFIEGPIPQDHPASYNTIALVKKSGTKYTIFCSGVIIASNIVMTAKHCLGDRTLDNFWIYFGDNTNIVDERLLRAPAEMSVYGPKDWESYFPAFDFGWIKIEGHIPNQNGENPDWPHFRPVPILTNTAWLDKAEGVYLAGYGNQSSELMTIVSGEKKHVATRFKKYINTPQLASLVLFEGDKGHSNCHGDSGGPAYVPSGKRIDTKEWFVFGTAAGFDLALTPESYIKTNDTMFPYIAKCENAQTLYTFAGDYVNWIESTTGQILLKSEPSLVIEPGILIKNTENLDSFVKWCENTNFKEPQWLTIRHLLIYAMDHSVGVHSESDIFMDCAKAEEALGTLTRIVFDENSRFGSLEPLAFLLSIRSLEFNKTPIADLTPLVNSPIDKIKMSHWNLKTFSDIPGFLEMNFLEEVQVHNSSLESLEGLESFSSLKIINIWGNNIQSLEPLSGLIGLTQVNFGSNQVVDLSALYGLSELELLVGSNNQLVSSVATDGTWAKLREVYLINNQLTDVDFLRDAKLIERIRLTGNPLLTPQTVSLLNN